MPAFNEDTGEDVVCPLCRDEEYDLCGHLVADFDRTFAELHGGALFDRDHEFKEAVERVFIPAIKSGTAPTALNSTLQELWESAELEALKGDEDGEGDG